jgi:hypothetical protein
MGQGNYYAIAYGITIGEYTEELLEDIHSDNFSEEIPGEGSYSIHTSYESDKNYIAVIIAIDDKFLSDWWGVGYIDNIIDYQNKLKNYKEFVDKAKNLWDKAKDTLKKHNLKQNAEIFLIKDYR